jgi:phasin family protein
VSGTEALTKQAQKLRKARVDAARAAAIKSAARIKSLKNPVRAFARSGVKLTAISQGAVQSLIELQEQIVTAALSNAAMQLERAAQTENLAVLVRDQEKVLRATRDRIVSDMTQAVAIFKAAGADVRKVATETFTKVTRPTRRARPVAKTTRGRKAKRAVRKSSARGRKA